jgi:hypothetical protein
VRSLACSLVGVDVSLNLLVGSPWRFIFCFTASFYFLAVVGLLVPLLDCFICNFTASFSVSVVVLLVLVFGGRYCFFSLPAFSSILVSSPTSMPVFLVPLLAVILVLVGSSPTFRVHLFILA